MPSYTSYIQTLPCCFKINKLKMLTTYGIQIFIFACLIYCYFKVLYYENHCKFYLYIVYFGSILLNIKSITNFNVCSMTNF